MHNGDSLHLLLYESTHITGCIQMEGMTCLSRQKSENLILFWKIFNFYFFVSEDNDTINIFEGYLTCKCPYFGKYFYFLSRDNKSFVPLNASFALFK